MSAGPRGTTSWRTGRRAPPDDPGGRFYHHLSSRGSPGLIFTPHTPGPRTVPGSLVAACGTTRPRRRRAWTGPGNGRGGRQVYLHVCEPARAATAWPCGCALGRRAKVGGAYGEAATTRLVVAVTARAVDGAATEAVLRALAGRPRQYAVARVALVTGATSRDKLVRNRRPAGGPRAPGCPHWNI